MFHFQRGTTILLLLVALLFFPVNTDARNQKGKRQDVGSPTTIAKSGWTVPLEGEETCSDTKHCKYQACLLKDLVNLHWTIGTHELSPPSQTSTLQYLAIGRGTITYTCDGVAANARPVYVGQETFLYDAMPLVPKFSSEQQFHSYIPRFLQYDYTSLDNSTLNCIGSIQTITDLSVLNIYGVDAFAVQVKELVNSPNNQESDLRWAHSQDDDMEWDVYRVETAGGGPPSSCGDQIISDVIPVEYAAEYWLYQRGK